MNHRFVLPGLAAAVVGIPITVGCGGATLSSSSRDGGANVADAGGQTGTEDAATTRPVESGAPSVDAGQPTGSQPLSPTYDGGGMPLSCAPNDGLPGDAGAPFPSCNFVNSTACQGDGECGCGCSCQCGVCNCNAPALVSTCVPGSGEGCCTSNDDCGPACYGLACVGSQCVPAASQTGPSSFLGTWQGSFSWPTTLYGGSCTSGLQTSSAGGGAGGPMTIVVVGSGSQLTFLLVSQQSGGEPLCALPFTIAANGTATLVPGSTCVTAGGGDLCTLSGPPSTAIQTFLSGTASLSAGTMTLDTADVFVEPESSGPECNPVPAGAQQVNVESMTAMLQRTGG